MRFIWSEEMRLFVIVIMDASPVQSSSKCGGSDFSIERILADEKDRREDSVDAPEWLCCTRYRPPRLPRSGSVRSRRAGRHARVPFTAAQAVALEAAYATAPYLAPPALKALAAALQLRDDRIKIWFQNRRARERREKATIISPPQGVTLPPTTMASSFPSHPWNFQTNLGIRNAPSIFNAYNKFRPTSEANDKCMSPDTLVSQMYAPPTNFDNRGSPRYDARNANEEDRPDTPLDIET